MWQPIETAPKDGTLILACSKNPSKMQGYFCAFWSDDFEAWMFSAVNLCPSVKYWQPLPPPPEK